MVDNKELSTYQKVLLILMTVMIVVFAVLCYIRNSKQWCEYRDTRLLYCREGNDSVYKGEIYGEDTVITVSSEGEIKIQHGDKTYGPYTAIAYIDNSINGSRVLEVYRDEEQIFNGSVEIMGKMEMYIREDGTGGTHLTWITDDGTRVDSLGYTYDPIEPEVYEIIELLAPTLSRDGNWKAWFIGTCVCFFNILMIACEDQFFRTGLRFYVRNIDVDNAEPSLFEKLMRYVTWTWFTLMAFAVFYVSLL